MAKSLETDFYIGLKFYLGNLLFLSLTYFFSPLLYFLIFFRNSFWQGKKDNPRILVIQTAKIGDMVCTTPVFKAIKEKYPHSFLAVLIIGKTKGIIHNNPRLDKIIISDQPRNRGFFGFFRLARDLAKEQFDWSFSFNPDLLNNILPLWALIPKRASFTSRYLTKSSRLSFIFANRKKEFLRNQPAFRQYLGLLGFLDIKKPDERRELFISRESRQKARDFLLKNNISEKDFLVGISVGSGNPLKDWDLEKFSQLADRLIENLKAKIIFIGSFQEKELIASVTGWMRNPGLDASGIFNLEEIGGLVERFKLFISVDTGPLYVANALNVPVVDIIGPFNIIEQLDLTGKCEVVFKELYCFPCVHIMPSVYTCREGHFRCSRDITPDDVYQAVLKLKQKYEF